MAVQGCPICFRDDHSNHLIWLVSDNFDGEIGPRTLPYPYLHIPEGVKPGDTVNVVSDSRGRRIQLIKPREYRELNVVTGWDYEEHYGDTVEYPEYTTIYEDVKTGILVADKDTFEKWISDET